MKKVLLIVAAMIGALFAAVGTTSPAFAYPELNCNVEVNAQTVNEGEKFVATGKANQFLTDDGQGRSARAAADSVTWEVTFNGIVRNPVGETFSETFTAPQVEETTKFRLTARATMPDATTTCEHSVDITVLPSGTVVTPPGEELPNTGGPRLELLFVGLVLLGLGAYAVKRGRKQAV